MKYKKFIVGALVALSLVAPVFAPEATYALFENSKDQACQGLGGCTTNAAQGLNNTLRSVINILSIIIGIVSVIMIIVGGAKYITSAGDSSKTAGARSTIISAVIGLVIVATAQFIVSFVLNKSSGLPTCPAGATTLPDGAACKK